MKTLLVSEIFPPKVGGSGRWFWETYSRMPSDLFTLAVGDDPGAAAFDATHTLDVVRTPLTLQDWGLTRWSSLRQYWKAFRSLRKTIRNRGITHLHCGRCIPCGWLALLLQKFTGLPYTVYVHGEDVNANMQGGATGTLSSRQLRWMTGRVLRKAAAVIANSRNSVRVVTEQWGVPAERVHLLHPGVDTSYFVPAPRDASIRQSLGWGDRPVLLTAGRLQRRKGQDTMIRALKSIRQTVPDVLYVIIGGGEDLKSLQELASKEGQADHVLFMGKVSDETLRLAYQQADVFVLANRQIGTDIEGFGMVLLEAQASGTPVVAGDSGGTAETLSPGVTGFVVPCETPEPVAKVLAELLADPTRCQTMGQAAREWAVVHFDWTALSRQAAELFGVPLDRLAPDRTEKT